MLHTIEPVTETCHDARLSFMLSQALESLSLAEALHTPTPKLSTKTKLLESVASFCPFLAVNMAGKVDRSRCEIPWVPNSST